jgi:hypothetical protein
MEGEGYPKYRFFSVKTGLWRDKKAHRCLIHVTTFRNLVVARDPGTIIERAQISNDLK